MPKVLYTLPNGKRCSEVMSDRDRVVGVLAVHLPRGWVGNVIIEPTTMDESERVWRNQYPHAEQSRVPYNATK